MAGGEYVGCTNTKHIFNRNNEESHAFKQRKKEWEDRKFQINTCRRQAVDSHALLAHGEEKTHL